jgi:hypothetical protein
MIYALMNEQNSIYLLKLEVKTVKLVLARVYFPAYKEVDVISCKQIIFILEN